MKRCKLTKFLNSLFIKELRRKEKLGYFVTESLAYANRNTGMVNQGLSKGAMKYAGIE